MKTLVVYKTTSGFTKKYAEWIAADLQADLVPHKQADAGLLASYDVIVYGGSLHAVGISGVGLIKKNLPRLTGKKIIVFTVGASPVREGILDEVLNRNFTEEQRRHIRFFYVRGGFDFEKLDTPNKLLMGLLKVKLQSKKNLTADEKGMLEAYDKPADFSDRGSIGELVGFARGS